MKKLLFILTLTVFALLCPPLTHAEMTFTKSPDNPLPVETRFGDWIQKGIYQPSVIHDETGYRMWYASAGETSFAIAYATSADGVHWNSDNLLRLPTGRSSIYNPFAVPAADGYTLFFSMDEPGRKARLASITQHADGTYDPDTVTDVLTPTEQWEANGLFGPFMVSENSKSFLFYSAWGNRGFQIGMAPVSVEGIEKCPNNPVITDVIADSPHIVEKGGVKYLFYHSGEGIRAISSTDPYSCSMHWSPPQTVLTPGPGTYDANLMIAPSVFVKDNEIMMYYSGLGPDGWTLNAAYTGTSSPSGTPGADPHPAVVFIPGLFASWNKTALLYNLPVSSSDWVLNPAVREYDGLLNTFHNLGYTTGTDFYVFNYDWRKSIQGITADLHTFMETVVKPAHAADVRIAGHSLGGLVARTYMQRYRPAYVSKLVTVGSPHNGAALAYKAAAGGDIEATSTIEWLMQKLVVQTYRDGFSTDRQIIKDHLPIVYDLIPLYSFLTRGNGSTIPPSGMSVRNVWLPQYADTSSLTDISTYITGTGTQTVEGYTIADRSAYDTLLDLYPDGRPTGSKQGEGDGIVPLRSALAGSMQQNGDHGQIIYRKDAIARVLDALRIPYDTAKISEGQKTGVSPSLIFLVFSPVRLELHHADKIYTESDGLLFVDHPEDGTYTLKAIGTGKGAYKILIGQTVGDTIRWNTVEGTITAAVPSSQTDTYPLFFSSTKPLANPLHVPGSSKGFDMFIADLAKANESMGKHKLEQAVKVAKDAKAFWIKKNMEPTRQMLFTAMKMLYDAQKKESDENRVLLTDLITDLESLMIDICKQPSPGYTLHGVNAIYRTLSRRFEQIQTQMLSEMQRKKHTPVPTIELQETQKKLEEIDVYIQQANVTAAEVLLYSVQRKMQGL